MRHLRFRLDGAGLTVLIALACSGCSGGPAAVVPRSDEATSNVGRGIDQTSIGAEIAQRPQATATLPPVAYVVADYTSQQGTAINYTAVTYAFNSSTDKLSTKPIISVSGLPEASTLSRDGAILYLSLPTTSASKPSTVGTLEAFSVTPTSGSALGKITYTPSTQFSLAYAGTTTGSGQHAYVYTDTSTSASLAVYSPDLRTKLTAGPSINAAMDYVAPAPGSLNTYSVDRAGNYRIYVASKNAYTVPLGGVTSALSPGIPVLAVVPPGNIVYALTVNRSGTGSSTIDVVNASNSQVVAAVGIPFPCYQIAVDPADTTVYAIGEVISGDTVRFPIAEMSTATNIVTKTFNVPDTTIRETPWLAVSTDSKHLLLSASSGSGSTSSSIDVVDPSTEKLVTTVALPTGPQEQGIQIDQIWTQP